MNGYCSILCAFYGPRFDPSDDTWDAIMVRRDGNEILIERGLDSEEAAEAAAGRAHAADLADNGQFGMGA